MPLNIEFSPAKGTSYTGHGASTGGLQGHSVGDLMPFIVYAKETPEGLRWGVMDSKWFDTGPVHTRESAHAVAAALKKCHADKATPFSTGALYAMRAAGVCRQVTVRDLCDPAYQPRPR